MKRYCVLLFAFALNLNLFADSPATNPDIQLRVNSYYDLANKAMAFTQEPQSRLPMLIAATLLALDFDKNLRGLDFYEPIDLVATYNPNSINRYYMVLTPKEKMPVGQVKFSGRNLFAKELQGKYILSNSSAYLPGSLPKAITDSENDVIIRLNKSFFQKSFPLGQESPLVSELKQIEKLLIRGSIVKDNLELTLVIDSSDPALLERVNKLVSNNNSFLTALLGGFTPEEQLDIKKVMVPQINELKGNRLTIKYSLPKSLVLSFIPKKYRFREKTQKRVHFQF